MKTAALIAILLSGSLRSPAAGPGAAPNAQPPVTFSPSSLVQTAVDGKRENSSQRRKALLGPTLLKLSQLIGGIWVGHLKTPTRDILTEVRCEWAMNGQAIRARGVIDKGGPDETETESMLGWDPVRKNVYSIDFHGAQDVFKGTVEANENTLEYQFAPLIGPPARWRATEELRDKDTMIFTLFDPKGSEWIQRFAVEYKRQK